MATPVNNVTSTPSVTTSSILTSNTVERTSSFHTVLDQTTDYPSAVASVQSTSYNCNVHTVYHIDVQSGVSSRTVNKVLYYVTSNNPVFHQEFNSVNFCIKALFTGYSRFLSRTRNSKITAYTFNLMATALANGTFPVPHVIADDSIKASSYNALVAAYNGRRSECIGHGVCSCNSVCVCNYNCFCNYAMAANTTVTTYYKTTCPNDGYNDY